VAVPYTSHSSGGSGGSFLGQTMTQAYQMIAVVVHELWRVHVAVNTAVLVNTNQITSLRSHLAAEQRLS
jgi:hypothetical protein